MEVVLCPPRHHGTTTLDPPLRIAPKHVNYIITYQYIVCSREKGSLAGMVIFFWIPPLLPQCTLLCQWPCMLFQAR